jgi:hypothetical protein
VLTQGEMLRAPDKEDFIKAQVNEIEGLIKLKVWKYMRICELPSTAQLINSIWSYQRKRTADGTFLKHKARFCADGSKQKQGIDFQ